MTCPACGGALTPVDVPGLTVDVCRDGCAGIWFDRSELRSVDEPVENAGEALVGLAGTPRVIVDATGRRRCPRCPDSVLMRHFYSATRAVAVDECPTCAGTWLDGGELAEIRAEYASGGDRRQAVQLLAEEILANDRMALMRKQLDEELPFYDASRSRIVASLLVVVYVGAAFMVAGSAAALRVFAWSVFPWMCVSIPHLLSGAVSPVLGKSRRAPTSLIWSLGWVVMLLPFIQLAIVWAGMPASP